MAAMRLSVAPSLGERVYSVTTAAGLALHVVPKPGFRNAHALLTVGYGSIDRCFAPAGGPPVAVPDGIAHFLEHRLFASSLGDVADRFAALGAELNAHTTFTSTAFFFSGTERVEECLEMLLDIALNPELAAEGVDRERGIIARELQLDGDYLEWVNFVDVLGALYGTHPLGVDIAGTPASIAAIDHELLCSCYRTFYRPDNMALIVGGDLDPEAVVHTVSRCLEGKERGQAPQLFRQPDGPGPAPRKVTTLPVAQPRLCLGFADFGPRPTGEALLREDLCAELLLDLLFGSSSDVYARHYESGLIDGESFGCDVYLEPEFSFCLVGGDTPDPGRLAAEI
ncbi:MAG: insulinase family protein, partial [Candidatus Latescibacteria bacterium]|nr:insulinase family protein [Candidatus Latescibacterota bacterium]